MHQQREKRKKEEKRKLPIYQKNVCLWWKNKMAGERNRADRNKLYYKICGKFGQKHTAPKMIINISDNIQAMLTEP